MCAVWQVPNTVAGPWGLCCPFRSLIISPPVQPGTRVVLDFLDMPAYKSTSKYHNRGANIPLNPAEGRQSRALSSSSSDSRIHRRTTGGTQARHR